MRTLASFVSAIFALASLGSVAHAVEPQTAPAAGSSPADVARAIVADAARGGDDARMAVARRTAEASPDVRRWIEANAEALADVSAGPLPEQPWGATTFRASAKAGEPAKVYLHVFNWHAGAKVIVYRLADAPRTAYVLADEKRVALPAERRGNAVVLSVPKKQPDAIATVIALEFEAEPKTVPLAISAGADGTFLLHAKDAIVYGVNLRYEPEPHKNTVGYWTNPADWVKWEFDLTKPGTYSIEILQGCGKGSGGSTVEFAVGEQVLPVTVEDTGGFQNFVPRTVGKLKFEKAGKYTLTVKPTRKQGAAIMDLRQVTLKEVGA